MRQLTIVWVKEMRESWNNRRFIWMPLVFILLGVMQPVSAHFMPQILKMSGGLPAGTVIHIPTPSAASVFTKAQSQYNTLGLLVLVLAFMGSVSNERQTGVLQLILVKPVSHASYLLGKWLSSVILTLISLFLGDIATWYYTVQLIGHLSIGSVFISALVYAVWLVLIVTITLFLSILMNSAIGNGVLSLFIAAILSIITGVLKWTWSPGSLPGHASNVVLRTSAGDGGVTSTSGLMTGFTMSLLTTITLIAALLIFGTLVFRKRTFD